VIAFLVYKLSALIVEVCYVDIALTGQKSIRLFPVMHGIDKHGFQLIHSVIQPQDIAEVVLIHSSKINFVIKIMRSFNDVKHLLRKFEIVLESFDSSINVFIVVILNNIINLILGFAALPQVEEFGVGHEKDVIVKKDFLHFELEFGVSFGNYGKGLLNVFVYVFLEVFQDEGSADSDKMGGIDVD
jgi:hypothetical protein